MTCGVAARGMVHQRLVHIGWSMENWLINQLIWVQQLMDKLYKWKILQKTNCWSILVVDFSLAKLYKSTSPDGKGNHPRGPAVRSEEIATG